MVCRSEKSTDPRAIKATAVSEANQGRESNMEASVISNREQSSAEQKASCEAEDGSGPIRCFDVDRCSPVSKDAPRKAEARPQSFRVAEEDSQPGALLESEAISSAALLSKLESQGFRCALSGRELTTDNVALDHRTPESKGGQHTLDNVWFTTTEVNLMKGTRTIEEFVSICVDVARTNGYTVTKN